MEREAHKTDPWPSYCCVAAFVSVALRELGDWPVVRSDLARRLGTRVGPDTANPWSLPVEPNPSLRGVLVAEAEKHIPPLIKEFRGDLCFRHIPFSTVMMGLFPEILHQIIGRGCVVGVGYDYSVLEGGSDVHRHVCRVTPVPDGQSVMLLDDSAGEPPAKRITQWPDLEAAVRAVKDGFWIIGRRDAMGFEYAPPWDGEA